MNGREYQLKNKTYQAEVVEILDNGDAILELPDDLVEDMGWYEGTKLNISMENGAIILKKLNTDMNQDVNTFIDACDQLPSIENVSLYRNLINEEYWEFQAAIKANDEVEQLDACMDMIWVILGYCKMKGYDVDGAWTEVARSNLAKIDLDTGKVIKRADGKVLKPEGWTAPVLAPFVKV
jgi:hypothetical protein